MVSLQYVSIITVTSYCTFLVFWLGALQGRGAMNPTTSALKNILFVGGLSQQGPQHWNRGNLPKYLTQRDLNKNKRLCHFDMLQFYLNVFECIWMYLMFVHTDSYCNGCITHHPSCLGGWARCHSHFFAAQGRRTAPAWTTTSQGATLEQPQRCQTYTDVRRTCRKS